MDIFQTNALKSPKGTPELHKILGASLGSLLFLVFVGNGLRAVPYIPQLAF